MRYADRWMELEILEGLQRLVCLSLERQPAGEVLLGGTAQMWCEAIARSGAWDQGRDAKRFRAAFATLAQTRKTWPAPSDFLEALPKPDVKALPEPRPSIEEIMRQYGFDQTQVAEQ